MWICLGACFLLTVMTVLTINDGELVLLPNTKRTRLNDRWSELSDVTLAVTRLYLTDGSASQVAVGAGGRTVILVAGIMATILAGKISCL